MNEQDREVVLAMERYGGNFAKQLARLACAADNDNLGRIKEAWPEYWFRYSGMANQEAAAILEKHPMAEYQKDE